MSPVQQLENRMDVCKARVETADRQQRTAETRGDLRGAREWKLNAFYHGGEVAALTFALGVLRRATPMLTERAPVLAVESSRSYPAAAPALTPAARPEPEHADES